MLWGGILCIGNLILWGMIPGTGYFCHQYMGHSSCASVIWMLFHNLKLALLGSEVLFCKREELALCSKYVQNNESFLDKLN